MVSLTTKLRQRLPRQWLRGGARWSRLPGRAALRAGVHQIAREPLAQFLLIGAGLFLLHAAVARREPVGEIRVSEGQLASLAALHERAWMRPPTQRELEGLMEGWIREEVAEREARALGLDRNDPVIRRRLRQKLEFLSEERSDRRQPSDGDLRAWLRDHAERYRRDAAYSFRQVYLDPSSSQGPPDQRAAALLARLNGPAPPDAATLGDPLLLLDPAFEALSAREVERLFGREFAAGLGQLKASSAWVGPLRSGYGKHLVRLERVQSGALPPLAQVRQEVERDWRQDQRRRQLDDDYRQWMSHYRVLRPVLPKRPAAGGPRLQPTAPPSTQPATVAP
jgi:hypothetical protein